MRMGALFNSKGWSLISEGLGQLVVATAGADLPQLWELFETFFRKVEDDFNGMASETASQVSGASATFWATVKKRKLDDSEVDTTNFKSVYPSEVRKNQVTPYFILSFQSLKFLLPLSISCF